MNDKYNIESMSSNDLFFRTSIWHKGVRSHSTHSSNGEGYDVDSLCNDLANYMLQGREAFLPPWDVVEIDVYKKGVFMGAVRISKEPYCTMLSEEFKGMFANVAKRIKSMVEEDDKEVKPSTTVAELIKKMQPRKGFEGIPYAIKNDFIEEKNNG